MNFEKTKIIVDGLNDKALEAHNATEAMKFAQAAVSVANSFCAMKSAQLGR